MDTCSIEAGKTTPVQTEQGGYPIRKKSSNLFSDSKFLFEKRNTLFAENRGFQDWISQRFKMDAVSAIMVDRVTGKIPTTNKDVDAAIMRKKAEMLNVILNTIGNSENVDPEDIFDSYGVATETLIPILQTAISKFEGLTAYYDINKINPYDINYKDAANFFYALYALSNFDAMLEEAFGNEITSAAPNMLNNINYEYAGLTTTQNQMDESEISNDISKHVSKKMKLLFSTIPLVRATTTNGVTTFEAITNQYMTENKIYSLANILRQAEAEWMAINPRVPLNMDEDPQKVIKIFLQLGMYGNINPLTKKEYTAKDLNLSEDDIEIKVPTRLRENYDKVTIQSLYAYLYGNTTSDQGTLKSLHECQFIIPASNGLRQFKADYTSINVLEKNIFYSLNRELLKSVPLNYLYFNSSLTAMSNTLNKGEGRVDRNMMLLPSLPGYQSIVFTNTLKTFFNFVRERSRKNNPFKNNLEFVNNKLTLPATEWKNNELLTAFFKLVYKIDITNGTYDGTLTDLANMISSKGSGYRFLIFLRDVANNVNIINDNNKITDKNILSKVYNLINTNEILLIETSSLLSRDKIMTIKAPTAENTKLPTFGLSSLIFKDSYMMNLYTRQRKMSPSNNFFTTNPGVFAPTGNEDMYPGSTIIVQGVIDSAKKSMPFLKSENFEEELMSMFGAWLTPAKTTINGQASRSLLMWQQSTYSDKSRAFFKVLNGKIDVCAIDGNRPFIHLIEKPEEVLRLDYYYRKRQLLTELQSVIQFYGDFASSKGYSEADVLNTVSTNLTTLLSNIDLSFDNQTNRENIFKNLNTFDISGVAIALNKIQDILTLDNIEDTLNQWAFENNREFIQEIHFTKYKTRLTGNLDNLSNTFNGFNFKKGMSVNRVYLLKLNELENFEKFKNLQNELADQFAEELYPVAQKYLIANPTVVSMIRNVFAGNYVINDLMKDNALNKLSWGYLVRTYLWPTNFLKHQYYDLTIGDGLKDKAKGNWISIEQEREARFNASCKRTIGYTSTKEELQQDLISGVGPEMKVAVVKELDQNVFCFTGNSNEVSTFNGASFIDPKASLLENVSYGQGTWTSKKTIGQSFTPGIPASTIYKWAEFPITNEMMRNTASGIKAIQMFKKMNSLPFDPSIDFTKNFATGTLYINEMLINTPYRYFDNATLKYKGIKTIRKVPDTQNQYTILTYEMDNEGKRLSHEIDNEGKRVKKKFEEETVTINNFYDMYQAFHGLQCGNFVNGKWKFDESVHQLMTNIMINCGQITNQNDYNINGPRQKNVRQPLRDCFISIWATDESIKNGWINQNETNAYYDDNLTLRYYTVPSAQFGRSLEAAHVVDGETTLSELTQTVSAINLMGARLKESNEVNADIQQNIYSKLNDQKIEISDQFTDNILNKTVQTKPNEVATHIINECRNKGISIPYNYPAISSQIKSSALTTFNQEYVRRQYPGIACVLCPSDGIVQLFRVGPSEGIVKRDVIYNVMQSLEDGTLNREAVLEILKNKEKGYVIADQLNKEDRNDGILTALGLIMMKNPNLVEDLKKLEAAGLLGNVNSEDAVGVLDFLLTNAADVDFAEESFEVLGHSINLVDIATPNNLPKILDVLYDMSTDQQIEYANYTNSNGEYISIPNIEKDIRAGKRYAILRYIPTDLKGQFMEITYKHQNENVAENQNQSEATTFTSTYEANRIAAVSNFVKNNWSKETFSDDNNSTDEDSFIFC